MKKIISILLVVAFAMSLSFTAFAAEVKTMTFEASTDVTEVSVGDTVYLTIDVTGEWVDVALVQYSVVYDTASFSTTTSGRAPWGFDSTWYNSTKDGNPENLGYITTPSFGANPPGTLNVMFLSTDGYYIDDGGALYTGTQTTTAGKIKFTALVDTTITADTFKLTNLVIDQTDGTHNICVIGGGDDSGDDGDDSWEITETVDGEEVTAVITYPTADGTATSAVNHIAVFGKNTYSEVIKGATKVNGEIVAPKLATSGTEVSEYKITFNGRDYYGTEDVEVGKAWCIIIVDSSNEIIDASGNLK